MPVVPRNNLVATLECIHEDMEGGTPETAMVEAPLKPAERIEAQQEGREHVEHCDNYYTQHKVRKVFLTQVL